MGIEFQFGMIEKFWRWMVVMVTHDANVFMALNCTINMVKLV